MNRYLYLMLSTMLCIHTGNENDAIRQQIVKLQHRIELANEKLQEIAANRNDSIDRMDREVYVRAYVSQSEYISFMRDDLQTLQAKVSMLK